MAVMLVMLMFQSALPCRERHMYMKHCSGCGGFNPRSRVGSDMFSAALTCAIICFNPRSRVGSDPISAVVMLIGNVFQSALPCRERLPLAVCSAVVMVFQSALPCRERPVRLFSLSLTEGFNPRSRVGSDNEVVEMTHEPRVSIRAPV